MANYVLEGPRWGTGAVGTGGGTVTWAVDSTVSAGFISQISAAFADWTSRANITFKQQASTSGAQITFKLSYMDGLDKVLGTTNYTYSGSKMISAAVTFDSGEGWHASGNQIVSNDAVNFFVVAVHEIGHALGLDHYNSGPAVMNSIVDRSITDLTPSDISGIHALYGAPNAFGTIQYSAASAGGTVYALYDGIFGRAPDTLGLEYYADKIAHGTNPASLAANFLASPEGQARLGAADNTAFIQQLYQNTLHRAADASGLQYHLDELAHGVSRVDVAQNFVFSPEHFVNLQPTLDAGLFVPDAQAAQVARVYYTMLGRAPDAGGLTYYTDQLDHGGTISNITQAFLNSAESQATYGKLSNSAYVDALYVNALGRHAEANGLSYWTDQLDHGVSRADLAMSLSQSAESQNLHLAQIELGWHLA